MHKSSIINNLRRIHWTEAFIQRQTGNRHHKGLFMFHKNVLSSSRSNPPSETSGSTQTLTSPARLTLVPSGGGGVIPQKIPSRLCDLIAISAHRCSSFFAEAAVLVLVLALLDRFMLKGRFETGWVLSAFVISLALLAASIVTDFSARRWLQRQ
jgi:hypothetical protein